MLGDEDHPGVIIMSCTEIFQYIEEVGVLRTLYWLYTVLLINSFFLPFFAAPGERAHYFWLVSGDI